MALGSVDVDDFIQTNFKDPDDWEHNFRDSKVRAQNIGQLPSGKEKLDCIQINYAPVRTEIELLNTKFWDTLVWTLKRSIIADNETVEKFTVESTEVLRKQPQSVEEIGEANKAHKKFLVFKTHLRFHEFFSISYFDFFRTKCLNCKK